jgi:hypothetical protein
MDTKTVRRIKMKNPALRKTNDYSLFKQYDSNRDVTKTKDLEKSMRLFGFIPAHPLHVVKHGNGFSVKDGHHRLYVAEKMGLPVWYVICDNDVPLDILNGAVNLWRTRDYMKHYSNQGKNDYSVVQRYQRETGIPISLCVAILAGNISGSVSKNKRFVSGTYTLADDLSYAYTIAETVSGLKKKGIKWASHSNFIRALGRCLWIDQFDPKKLIKKAGTYPFLFEKQASLKAYTDMIEKAYNWKSPNKIPLAFLVEEEARKRRIIKEPSKPNKKPKKPKCIHGLNPDTCADCQGKAAKRG